MNSIEKLPKSVKFDDGRYFEIQIYLTAWGKLCLSYVNPFRDDDSFNDRILSVVVEGDNKIERKMTNDYTVIFDAVDIDEAVDITLQRIENLKKVYATMKFIY